MWFFFLGWGLGVVECLGGGENCVDMFGYFYVVLFLVQYVVFVDQEGVVVDVYVFFVVEFFQFDYVEQLVDCFIFVVDQFEGEFLFVFEVFVGFQVVVGDVEDFGIGFLECCVLVVEVLVFGGVIGGVVFWVEVQDDLFVF